MVIGDLGVVKCLFALAQFAGQNGLGETGIGRHGAHHFGHLGIDVVAQVGGVDTRVGGHFFLIERLYELEGGVGAEVELLVALNLQAREVEETRRGLLALFLLNARDRERELGNALHHLAGLALGLVAPLGGVECHAAVQGLDFPVVLGHKVLDLALAGHHQSQGGCLHTPYREHIAAVAAGILEGVEPGGIDAQQPVAYGTRQPGIVQVVFFLGIEQVVEALAQSLVGHRVHPQSLHRYRAARQLVDPALYEFAFLAGIAAVDELVALLDEGLDAAKLPLHAGIVLELDAKALRKHGQGLQRPSLPHLGVVGRFLELAQVAQGPGHAVAVTLVVAIVAVVGPEYGSNVACHAGLLGHA